MRLGKIVISGLGLGAAVLFATGCTSDAITGSTGLDAESSIVGSVVAASPGNGNFRMNQGNATRDLSQVSASGWLCVPIPDLGVHCFAPGAFRATASLTVLVFDTQDPTESNAAFLGTEILIRDDLYAGQPCPAEGGGDYVLLPASETGFPVDYRACHHYVD